MSERKMTGNEYTLNIDKFSAAIVPSSGPTSFSFCQQGSAEIMRLDKDGMVFMGERITDAGEAYEAWMKTMAMMQERKDEDKKLLAYKALVESLEARIASHEKTRLSYQEARDTLDSERACNARLTKELAERESSDEPVAWAVFDGEENWGLIQYLGNENFEEEFLKRNPDPMYRDWVKPLYRHPPPARKLTDEEILEVAAKHPPVYPWMLEGDMTLGDLRKMTISFSRAIECRIIGEEQ